MRPKILIVDDSAQVRTTLRTLLDWHSLEICGEAKDGNEAIEKLQERKPDIVLIDIGLPKMNGVAAAAEIRRISPTTKVVFLTIYDGP